MGATQTYRADTTTDGAPFAQGGYMAEGILPQDLDRELDGEFPSVYPVVVPEKRILADHHALILTRNLYAAEQKMMPWIEKVMNMEQWHAKNLALMGDQRLERRMDKMTTAGNVSRNYDELISKTKRNLEDR